MLALALAPHVRVVGVAPGLTLTSQVQTPEKREALHGLSPLGRAATAPAVAAAVAFALENQSITGTTLLVDGGQHLMTSARNAALP
jgi:NAD(P)-dependent dehydrogenase (short-subunit alcohol dehydrogenase family)